MEANLERYHYTPGAFLVESDKGDSTPNADDKGKHRTDEKEAEALAKKRLQAKQVTAKTCTFETNVLDLAPGVVMSMLDHPRGDLGADKGWLIVESRLTGTDTGEWSHSCKAVSVDAPYRPSVAATPKPKVSGIESATVVGPPGEEIHTDEFGRVRVHFHWDRESKMDDNSSCWIHVSQPWAGGGFGGINLPRVGHEVLVDFLSGDPDRPVIVGRVYTNVQKVPYTLPANKTQSGWKSQSSPGGGGFNELRFEDKAGKEQVYIQAQKDLDKLVKHDETVTIGHDRSKSVGNDDSLVVGNNRSRMVGNNETVTIGNNQSLTVGANQSITLPGGNQTETITGNRTFTLTGNLTETITGNSTLTQTGDQAVTLTGNRTVTQTGNQTDTLTGSRTLTHTGDLTETITGGTTLTHTGAATVTRTGASTLTQIGDESETLIGAESVLHVGAKSHLHMGSSTLLQIGSETEVRLGDETHLQVGNLAEMRLGNATHVQVGNRDESITGTETLNSTGAMTITSSAALKINGATINVEAGGNVVIKGSIIKLNC